MGQTYDKLKATGMGYGLKPSRDERIAAGPILASSGLSAQSACLLQAWLGGAHDAHQQGISWQIGGATIGQPGFSFVAYELSAQAACGIPDSWWIWSLPSIDGALSELRAIDGKAAELVESAGRATAAASAKKQMSEAEADAAKLRNQALSAVSVGAIGIGTVVAVAAVAYLVFMANTAKGK